MCILMLMGLTLNRNSRALTDLSIPSVVTEPWLSIKQFVIAHLCVGWLTNTCITSFFFRSALSEA